MITIKNYKKDTKNIDFKSLPEALQSGHKNFNTMVAHYETNSKIKEVLDTYIDKLNKALFCENDKSQEKNSTKKANKKASSEKKTTTKKSSKTKSSKKEKDSDQKEKSKTSTRNKKEKPNANKIEKVHDEIKFIKRFLLLNGKDKTKKQILLFINALQRAISERRIRKTSKYASEITTIQEQLVDLYNRMNQIARIEIDEKSLETYYAIAYSEAVMPETSIIKQYIGLNGKADVKEKAKRLLVRITKYIVKDKITENSKYFSKIKSIKKSLESYIEGKTNKIKIHEAELNGLQGIANCNTQKKKS